MKISAVILLLALGAAASFAAPEAQGKKAPCQTPPPRSHGDRGRGPHLWRAFSELSDEERAAMVKLQREDPEKFREAMHKKVEEIVRREKAERQIIQELAEKYNLDIMTMTGFLDGINDSLVTPNPIEEMEEDTEVSLVFDKELLYKNMVAADADWLYGLEEWEPIFDEEKRAELYKEQKRSTTIVKEAKVFPNDPCPCGSGKKYKKCCGRNAS